MGYSGSISRGIFHLTNFEPRRTCLHSKAVQICVNIIGISIPIIFVVLGVLGLAGSASFPLLLIGSVGLGMSGLGLVAFAVQFIVLKWYQSRSYHLVENEPV
ncbi:hypothetical protein [Chlamydia felis Fe/C-56]|uniref:Uncharacterized protein n=1 Tax=Chlamydia felis (strain Fe/C-56) TaxID=264202 RepID=Q254R7_CHLFF|nr:hypothetical protein [Chlamydia felis Fe/C-56]